jgi:hypothetical protein
LWPEAGSRPEGSDDEGKEDEASRWRPDVEGSDGKSDPRQEEGDEGSDPRLENGDEGSWVIFSRWPT